MANLKLYLVTENRKHVAPELCVDLLCSLVRRNKMDALGAQPFLSRPQEEDAVSSRPNTAVAALPPPASDSHRARHHPAPPPSWLLPRFARRRQDPGSFRELLPLAPDRALQTQEGLLFGDTQTGATRPGARKTASLSVTPPSRRPRPGRGARPKLPCRVLTPWLKPLRGAAAEPGAAAAAAKANAAAGTAASNTPWWQRTCGSGGGSGRTARKDYICGWEEEKWPQCTGRRCFIGFAPGPHHRANPSAAVKSRARPTHLFSSVRHPTFPTNAFFQSVALNRK